MQKLFSDGQGEQQSQKFLKYVSWIVRPLNKSCKNDFPMVEATTKSQKFRTFFSWCFQTTQNKSCKQYFSDDQGKQTSQMSFIFSWIVRPSTTYEKLFFRASLEPQGPRDPPFVKERKILFRIALTRALYDQMAPQLCPFYVPENNLKFFKFFPQHLCFGSPFLRPCECHSRILGKWLSPAASATALAVVSPSSIIWSCFRLASII